MNCYKSNELFKTELQWLKEGYILKDEARGEVTWNNRFCKYRVRRYSIIEVVKNEMEAKELLKLLRKHYHLNRIYKKLHLEKIDKYREEWNTPYQWKEYYQREIKQGAKGKLGEELNKELEPCCEFGSSYYYYHISDTVEL